MAEEKSNNREKESLLNMHKAYLEAFRHREQEIFKYLAILGPALGGFIWLLRYRASEPVVFAYGTMGVLLTFLLGAVYSLVLGYNYRYLALQVAKLESDSCLELYEHMLAGWPRSPREFAKRYRIGVIPWCTPPEIIKVFWFAFLLGIAGITCAASWKVGETNVVETRTVETKVVETNVVETKVIKTNVVETNQKNFEAIIIAVGSTCFGISLLAPIWFGAKLQKICKKEPLLW